MRGNAKKGSEGKNFIPSDRKGRPRESGLSHEVSGRDPPPRIFLGKQVGNRQRSKVTQWNRVALRGLDPISAGFLPPCFLSRAGAQASDQWLVRKLPVPPASSPSLGSWVALVAEQRGRRWMVSRLNWERCCYFCRFPIDVLYSKNSNAVWSQGDAIRDSQLHSEGLDVSWV